MRLNGRCGAGPVLRLGSSGAAMARVGLNRLERNRCLAGEGGNGPGAGRRGEAVQGAAGRGREGRRDAGPMGATMIRETQQAGKRRGGAH